MAMLPASIVTRSSIRKQVRRCSALARPWESKELGKSWIFIGLLNWRLPSQLLQRVQIVALPVVGRLRVRHDAARDAAPMKRQLAGDLVTLHARAPRAETALRERVP